MTEISKISNKKIELIVSTDESKIADYLVKFIGDIKMSNILLIDGRKDFRDFEIDKVIDKKCSKETEFIVIYNVSDFEAFDKLIYSYYNGIEVKKANKDTFLIYPKIIIACHGSITYEQLNSMSPSFTRRVEIINLT